MPAAPSRFHNGLGTRPWAIVDADRFGSTPTTSIRGSFLLSITGLAIALALGGCTATVNPVASASPSADAGAASSSPTASAPAPASPPASSGPTATSSPTGASPAATIPTSCTGSVPAGEYSRLFGTLILNEVRPTSSGPEWTDFYVSPEEPFVADAVLLCHWSPNGSTEDVDNLSLSMGTAAPEVLAARQESLEADGSTCIDTLAGRSCQHAESSTYYGEQIDTTHTFFVRGDTWVKIVQSGVATEGLLDAVVQQTWV